MLETLAAAPGDYDLIVTDYAMPLMSGTDMLQHARAIRPDIPGIIISGYAANETVAKAPCDVTVLRKPFTLEQMGAAIAGVVLKNEGRSPSEAARVPLE
jgi:DNA-binding NtrC family response regulator